jgi:hypothetical protein
MPDTLKALLLLLQDSALGAAMRSAAFLYPIVESIHIIGIALLVGPAFLFDLRILGVGRNTVSAMTAARVLLPVSRIGIAIAVLTGVALLSAQATSVASSGAAPWKLGLLILAGVNVLIFHLGPHGRVDRWEEAAAAPLAARVCAALSLILWTGVILAGRLIAYT